MPGHLIPAGPRTPFEGMAKPVTNKVVLLRRSGPQGKKNSSAKKRVGRRKSDKKNERKLVTRPERYAVHTLKKRWGENKLKEKTKTYGRLSYNPADKVYFVIRIRGNEQMPDQVKKLFSSIGLTMPYTGVFIRATKEIFDALSLFKYYLIFGPPSMETVRLLIGRRACIINESGTKIPLRDNRDIERELKDPDITCSEELAYVIYTGGEGFEKCQKILAPFSMYRNKTELSRESLVDEPTRKVYQGYVGKQINETIRKLA